MRACNCAGTNTGGKQIDGNSSSDGANIIEGNKYGKLNYGKRVNLENCLVKIKSVLLSSYVIPNRYTPLIFPVVFSKLCPFLKNLDSIYKLSWDGTILRELKN